MQLTRDEKLGSVGLCIFIFSIIYMSTIYPAVIKAVVRRKVGLKEGWRMREELWGEFPFPIYMKFYLFNVTNPDHVDDGAKPILQEVGPYVYDDWEVKTNRMDHEEDDTISFTRRNTYFFNTEMSFPLTGDEEVIVPNYFVLALVNSVLKEKPSALPLISKAVNSIYKKPKSIFIKAKVRDILFDGLTIDCAASDFGATAVCSEIEKKWKEYRLKKLGENVYSFSLWGSINGTDSMERTRIYRGLKNIMDLGVVVEHNNKNNISIWGDEYCDTFNGTEGSIFHPFFDKKGRDDLISFTPALCRSYSLQYFEKSKYAGLSVLKYRVDIGIDPENNPLHKCYCDAPDKCLKKGPFDLYRCTKAPLIATNPHFLWADPYYLNAVEGLSPDEDKHALQIYLLAFAGAPLNAHVRLQLNMFISKLEKFKLMKKFPEALLPLFWIDRNAILPDYVVKELKAGLTMNTLGQIFQVALMLIGLGTMGYAGFQHYRKTVAKKKLSRGITMNQENEKISSDVDKKIPISAMQLAASLPALTTIEN